jgi:hypothetical protein
MAEPSPSVARHMKSSTQKASNVCWSSAGTVRLSIMPVLCRLSVRDDVGMSLNGSSPCLGTSFGLTLKPCWHLWPWDSFDDGHLGL